MRRNCNLELRLVPYSDSLSSEDFSLAARYGHNHNMTVGESGVSPQNQQQQLTIFYNGKVCTCDVTEFQAKSILLLASREMEPASPPNLESQLYSPNSGLSMKRSLQRFLQKRKHRSLATSPY